jgi:putative ABC transport system permease protein
VSAQQRDEFLASSMIVLPASQGRSNLRRTLDRPLWVLMAGTLLLLLLASLNVASLFLARGVARSREIRTRMALGASRGRITGLLLVDSMLIAFGGGLLGLVVAPAVSQMLLSLLPRNVVGFDLTSRLDGRVFVFAFVVSGVTGALCGLAPAWQAGRTPLISWLKERSSSTGANGVRLRKALVVGQMAFTLILLVCAGLFVQTLARLHAKGPGFPTTNLLTFRVNPALNGYPPETSARMLRELFERLKSLPNVERGALTGQDLLTGGSWNSSMTIQDDARVVTDRVHLIAASAGFFETLGIQQIAGRVFDERDVRPVGETGLRSIVVNESFARRYFAKRNPIGRRVGLGSRPDTKTDIEIVGIVKDFSYRGIREQTEQAFVPFFERGGSVGTFYLRVRGRPESAFTSIRAAVARIDPTLPLFSMRTLDEQIDRSLTTERMLATLSGGFGAIALILSIVGLYGVMSFVVSNRTQEIGIRLALGATRSIAVRLVVADAVAMIGAGTAIALPCVWALSRLIEAQLFGVRPVDAPTIAAATSVLTIVGLAATMIPAWRAATVRPTEALRNE